MNVRSDEFLLEVARGKVNGAKLIHKFGANRNIGSTWATICTFGGYETPTVPMSLELVSTSTDDHVDGIGARVVEVYGLDENWDAVEVDVEMNGITPVVLPQTLRRVYRMHVKDSGTYATLLSGSHAGEITLRPAGGGVTFANIVVENGFPIGTSEIGCYSIPRGYTGFLVETRIAMEAAKICDVAFFYRQQAHITTGGHYPAMFALDTIHDVSNFMINKTHQAYSRPLVGPCDLGFLVATVSGTAKASVSYSLLILDNNLRDSIQSL